ncbi:MAG: Na+/H+ antiporter NhaA [Propioniciclava sp.]
MASPRRNRAFSRGSYAESLRVGEILRQETTGGILLMVAAVLGVLWANSPWAEAYFGLRDTVVGPHALHLDLSLGAWAADGLLAIFFFLVGLELKHEIIEGDLRDPQRAIVPVVAAVAGVAFPAGLFLLVNANSPTTLVGWAIPTATDIAFAVAVLAIVGTHLPSALRVFLLTLAVVDDLIAILIIAFVYTEEIHGLSLALFLVPIAAFALLVNRFQSFFASRQWAAVVILLPIAFVAWALLHSSGIHATIAGVILGFVTPVRPTNPDADHGLAKIFEHRFRPVSTGFAVPVFAFFSAGVALGGWSGLLHSVTTPVALGIMIGLIVGKPIGIVGSTFLLTRLTRATLDHAVKWIDLLGVGLLAGIGFTVSLLVAELSFGLGSEHNDEAKVGVLLASVLAALIAAAVLVPRNRHYREVKAIESIDADASGTPDVYEVDGEAPRTS